MENVGKIPDGFLIETEQLKNLEFGDFVVLINGQTKEPFFYKAVSKARPYESFSLTTLLGIPEWFKPYYKEIVSENAKRFCEVIKEENKK
jgi:hypothetical protein